MDKETLSNYGWIVICVLVLAVMLALATPFGTFVADAIKSTTQGLFDVNQNALNSTGLINIGDQSFGEGGNGGTGEIPVVPGEPETPVEPTPCTHANTKVEGAATATCTTDGHTGKTVCIDCSETISTGSVITATGHTTLKGSCDNCSAITFSIRDGLGNVYSYQMDEDMTWEQWLNSPYHTEDDGIGTCSQSGSVYVCHNGDYTRKIHVGASYGVSQVNKVIDPSLDYTFMMLD